MKRNPRAMNKPILSVAFFFFSAASILSAATISADIVSDTTYDSNAEEDYSVDSSVSVAQGATLTLGESKTLRVGSRDNLSASVSVAGTLDTSYRAYVYGTVSVTGTWLAGNAAGSAIYFYDGGTVSVGGDGRLVLEKTKSGMQSIYVAARGGGTLELDSADNLVIDASGISVSEEDDALSLKLCTVAVEKLTVKVGSATFSGTNAEAWDTYLGGIVVKGFEDWAKSFAYNESSGLSLDLTRPVPEPSAFALLAGTAAAALAAVRRRRRSRAG